MWSEMVWFLVTDFNCIRWVEKFLNNFVCFTQDTQKNAIFVHIKPASFDFVGR
jgi:hypothetical protein